MRLTLLKVPVALLASAFVALGQPDKAAQKTLEKDLYKKTPYVRKARVDGCRISLSVDVSNSAGFSPLVGAMPSITPTDGVVNTGTNAGPDSRNLILFELLLSDFDASGIVMATTKRREHTVIMFTGRSRQAVTRIWHGKKENSNSLDLTAYSKDSKSLADSLLQAISACKKPK